MYTEEPTEKLALQVWWAITWRSAVFSFMAAFIMGQIITTIVYLVGGSMEAVQTPAFFASILLGAYVAVRVVRHLMIEGFGEYRLCIIKKS